MALLEDYLYSEEFLFEGEQADEYRARKAAEKAAKDKETDDYLKNRWKQGQKRGYDTINSEREYLTKPGRKMTKQNPNYGIKHPIKTLQGKIEDEAMFKRVYDKHFKKEGRNSYLDKHIYNSLSKGDRERAQDARFRHARRHPKSESAEVELYEGAIDLI